MTFLAVGEGSSLFAVVVVVFLRSHVISFFDIFEISLLISTILPAFCFSQCLEALFHGARKSSMKDLGSLFYMHQSCIEFPALNPVALQCREIYWIAETQNL